MTSSTSRFHSGLAWKYLRVILALLVGCIVLAALWLWAVDALIETQDVYTSAPAATDWIEVGGNSIAYQYFPAETTETIVLIGGTTAWSGVWKNTVDDLRGKYNIYALDLPPFGYSVVDSSYTYNLVNQASVINGFLRAVNARDITLIAHSYGAGPAMEAVLQEPGNYKRFVLIDGAIHVDRPDKTLVGFLQNVFGIPTFRYFIASLALHVPGFMEASLQYLVYDNSQVTDFWVDTYNQPLRVEQQSQRIAKWFYDFVFANGTGFSSDSANYRLFDVPTVILWGREDTFTPLEQGLKLQEIIPINDLVIMDKVGHIPMIDDHERYMQVLREYLAR